VRGWRALVILALAAYGCGGSGPPPNLVIVTLDTTRADHLGLYGYSRATSPALDAFGKRSIVFERAIMPMATTLPTHVSFFTATHPLEHGVLYNTTYGAAPFRPTPELRTLAQVAQAAGWHTAAFVSAAPLKRGTGIEHGFEHFDEPRGLERRAGDTTDAALAWLEGAPEGRFLLWVHYFDAHFPYAPPAPYATMFSTDERLEEMIAARRIPRTTLRPFIDAAEDTRTSINTYDGELRYQDAQLGRLLAALEARPDWDWTTVVIVGDHGEGLGQHREAGHGGTWDEQLHVPFVLRVPDEAPRRVRSLVTAVDVIPTVLGRLDAPALAPVLAQSSGHDALAADARPRPIVSQDTGRPGPKKWGRRRVLTSERWKLFRVKPAGWPPRFRLFDLSADPYELVDVSAREVEVTKQLNASLELTVAAQRRKGALLAGTKPQDAPAVDPKLVEQLKALGYVDQSAEKP
jgi:arylsulfatase